MEFQRFKHHPMVAELLKGGKRVAYGARAISEGGWQSLPKTSFPGGALLGCSAGLVNLPRIKGNHNAMLSGKAAAEAAFAAIKDGRSGDDLTAYDADLRSGPVAKDLKRVRNVKPLWSKFGLMTSLGVGGFDMWTNNLFGLSLLGTLKHGKNDAQSTGLAADYPEIDTYNVEDEIASYPAVGHDLNFFCLDFTNTAYVRAFNSPTRSFVLVAQCTDSELEEFEAVYRGVLQSLRIEDEDDRVDWLFGDRSGGNPMVPGSGGNIFIDDVDDW